VAISTTGQYQTIGQTGGYIYQSSNFGSSFTSVNTGVGTKIYKGISLSSSGLYQIAVSYGDYIYISSDYGATWSNSLTISNPGIKNWVAVEISGSGQYITALAEGNYIWVSSNFGNSWTSITSTGILTWKSVAISASGMCQSAVASGNYIWTSNDYGNTWSSITSTGTQTWTGITITASGNLQIACVTGNFIYGSNDWGNTWVACYSLSKLWTSVFISASGQNITAVESGGYIYTCANSTSYNAVIGIASYAGTASGVTGVAGSLFYDTTATAGANALKISTGSAWQTVKSFVIDHPKDKNKYLVHGCLEGPEAGVYYRGKGEITNNESVEIELPDYVCDIAKNLTIQISGIYDGSGLKLYNADFVVNNKFNVYGPNGKFSWIVHGSRADIEVEPSKHNTIVKGNGPYKWI